MIWAALFSRWNPDIHITHIDRIFMTIMTWLMTLIWWKKVLFGIFELGFWCPISYWCNLASEPRPDVCGIVIEPMTRGTAGPRRASFKRVEKLGRWRQGDELSTAWWWLEHEMRRNDEPTRYGLLMFIGDISIDTIVDGILIYDSNIVHVYITGWWWLEPWNLTTFHILGIVTPTDFHIFQRGCLFVHVLGIVTPTDELIFQRGRYTTKQYFIGVFFLKKNYDWFAQKSTPI